MTRLTAGFCCLLRKRGCVRSERSHSGKTGKKVFGLLRQASCAPGNGAVMFVPHITAPCSFVAYLSHILQLPSVASLRSVCIPAKQADTREPSHTCIAGMPLLLHVPPPAGRKRHWHKGYAIALLAQTYAYASHATQMQATLWSGLRVRSSHFWPSPRLLHGGWWRRSVLLHCAAFVPHLLRSSVPPCQKGCSAYLNDRL